MTDYQPLNYRLRCHTKRGDLPPDVLRDICEAYVRLLNLEEECTKNKQLQAERDEARREVCELKSLNFEDKITPKAYAELRKWDCFEENSK